MVNCFWCYKPLEAEARSFIDKLLGRKAVFRQHYICLNLHLDYIMRRSCGEEPKWGDMTLLNDIAPQLNEMMKEIDANFPYLSPL